MSDSSAPPCLWALPNYQVRRVKSGMAGAEWDALPFGATRYGRNLDQGHCYYTLAEDGPWVSVLRGGKWDRGWHVGNFEGV